jgi:hypothetical protein
MLRRSGFLVTGVALAMFAMGRVESFVVHSSFSGSAACAQQWDDPADDASSQDDAGSQPDRVPDVSGSYNGSLDDHIHGASPLTADVIQKGSKLSGTSNIGFSTGRGSFKGKVTSNGTVKARLSVPTQKGCFLDLNGTFENGDEISGVYTAKGCGKPADFGTFDITD